MRFGRPNLHSRKALLPDAVRIHELICHYSPDGTLLPRSLTDICENVRDFVVVEDNGQVIACAALHIYALHLAEIRSVAVAREAQGRNAGTKLVQALIAEAKHHKIARVFLFTRVPEFFGRLGFSQVEHNALPEKVHKDCLACPRRNQCDEIAMVYVGAEKRRQPVQPAAEPVLRVL